MKPTPKPNLSPQRGRKQMHNTENHEAKIVATVGRQLQSKRQDIRKTILAQLSWSHHRTIFSRCKTEQEREFYLRISIKENYSVRELDRQISASLFERAVLGKVNIVSLPEEFSQDITNAFKDSYVFEFLNQPEPYSENDLQKGLIKQMKNFILELGRDFIFIDEEYRVQVGNSDFYIDLLFYHRGLQCLVAFELKAEKFKTDHLGSLISIWKHWTGTQRILTKTLVLGSCSARTRKTKLLKLH